MNNHLAKISQANEGAAKDPEVIEAANELEISEQFAVLKGSKQGAALQNELTGQAAGYLRQALSSYPTAPHQELIALLSKIDSTMSLLTRILYADSEREAAQKELDELLVQKYAE